MENKTKNKVFLGGTHNNTNWRDLLIPHLKIDYFDSIIKNKSEYITKKEECNIHLYYINNKMIGFNFIAELIESCFNKDVKTLFICDKHKFTNLEVSSLKDVAEIVKKYGGDVFIINTGKTSSYRYKYDKLADYINKL